MFEVRPIGVARTPFREKMEAPRQAAAARDVPATIELFAGQGYEDALADLDGFTHVWIVYWFDRVTGWKPKVLPPRSGAEGEGRVRRGLFSTRSPHRPNPVGLSVARLVRVDGLSVHVTGVDMLDGTPVIDLKPYIRYADAIADAGDGWLAADPRPAWTVRFEPLAREQLDFLRDGHGVELEAALVRALSLGPQPHAYRRIRKVDAGFVIAVKAWRARFRAEGREVVVERVASGERGRAPGGVHGAFVERFGRG